MHTTAFRVVVVRTPALALRQPVPRQRPTSKPRALVFVNPTLSPSPCPTPSPRSFALGSA